MSRLADALVRVADSRLEAALAYAAAGVRVLPIHSVRDGACSCTRRDCGSPGKHPRTARGLNDATTEQPIIRSWWEQWPDSNVGIATGGAGGLVVLDVDPRNGGNESLRELIRLGALPATLHVRTGGDGLHYYLGHPGGKIRSKKGFLPGLDLQADGSYVVAPPSGHVSGGIYRVVASEDLVIAACPHRLLEMAGIERPLLLRDNGNGPVRQGNRNTYLTSVAGRLRRRGYERTAIESELLRENAARCTPPLEHSEVARIALSISRRPQGSGRAPRSVTLPFTDYGNAQRLVLKHGKDLRFVHAWGEWLIWDGRRWLRDVTGEVIRRAKDTVRATYAEAADSEDTETRKKLADHARRSEAEPSLRRMVELAKSEPEIAVTPDQLDADSWLLTCSNGTLDLKAGHLREHRRQDLITKLAPAEFDPNAVDADWNRVISEACGGNLELEEFLARALGYSITGDTSEEKFFFVHGPSASGKSTVIEVVKSTLGDYAATTDFETFLKRNQPSGPRNDVARLAGARFVSSIEVEDGKRLAEGLVKQMTGGDTISARFLHHEFFEFRPQMKLWLAANHAPRVRSDDDAMWRRIVRIPFEHVIPEEKRDPGLKSRLRSSSEVRRAVLAWLVRGCLAWQREGLSVPPVVRGATTAYREEMNPLQEFIADRCVLDQGAVSSSAVLWSDYQAWAKDSGERWPLNRRQFGEALRACGFKDGKRGQHRTWHGLRLAGLQPREDAWARGSSRGPSRDLERGTDGTGRDTTSGVIPESPPSPERNIETHVLSRPASNPRSPAVGEWDRVTDLPDDEAGECPQRPEGGLEADSGGGGDGAEGGEINE
jgi:putative DNA primase/helicase